MKKIIHLIETDGIYGAEQVVLNVALETKAAKKYEPYIWCIKSNKNDICALMDRAIELTINANAFTINKYIFPYHVLRLIISFIKSDVALIHCHGYKASIIGCVIGKLLNIPYFSTCHLWYINSDRGILFRSLIKFEIFLHRHSRKIVAVSESIKNILLANKVPHSNIEIIKNGIYIGDLFSNDLSNNVDTLRSEFRIDSDTHVLLNVGRLSEQKAQLNLILATKALIEKGFKIKTLIVGDGELRDKLESVICAYSLENHVHLVGFSSNISAFLRLADVFVLPSLDEGLPISLLEAMAFNLPVVVTPVGEIPHIIENKVNGFIVMVNNISDIADAVIYTINNKEATSNIARNAYLKVVEEFTSSIMYNRYAMVYQELLNE